MSSYRDRYIRESFDLLSLKHRKSKPQQYSFDDHMLLLIHNEGMGIRKIQRELDSQSTRITETYHRLRKQLYGDKL